MGLNDGKHRCPWALSSEREADYHDREWGAPVTEDRKLFELLILEGAQAGLSWRTILNKRAAYAQAFDEFDAKKIARYAPDRIERLLQDAGIVRNRLKIGAAVVNARRFIEVRREFGSFAAYLWRFTDDKPIMNHWASAQEVPARSAQSDALSKDLKKRGFKFVGTTICYAYMQSIGMVNDHLVDCFRHREIERLSPHG